MALQVKCFHHRDPTGLENDINKWLKSEEGKVVTDFRPHCSFQSGHNVVMLVCDVPGPEALSAPGDGGKTPTA